MPSTPSREYLFARLANILRRFVRLEDAELSDVDFVTAVYSRFVASREDYIIDPNE